MTELDPLSEMQRVVLREFYAANNQKIALDKAARSKVWDNFILNRRISDFSYLQEKIPSLYHEIEKAIQQRRNIQSAVFSECVYSQAIADHFGLIDFHFFPENKRIAITSLEETVGEPRELTVRYSYSHGNNQKVLFQAGGAAGVDCAFRNERFPEIAMIELKEPYARASDPNLPKYKENGLLVSTESFERENPQFTAMLHEQIGSGTNIFEHLGSNINNFSNESIGIALTENYQGAKFAHVICTEDKNGNLVMIPSNHVTHWARMEGEIRPSGRNSCKAWSTSRLVEVLDNMGASHQGGKVKIDLTSLRPTKARGGSQISRYRLDPIFFVRAKDLTTVGDMAVFDLKSVKQNIPSITAKMNFENLDIEEVRNFYMRTK